MSGLLNRFARDARGGTAIEYSLIAALIFIAALGAMQGMGGSVTGMWDMLSNAIVTAQSGT